MTERRTSTKGQRDLTAYFLKNPQEELSIEDAAAKFSVGVHYAAASLSALVGDGLLERVSVYRLKRKAEVAA